MNCYCCSEINFEHCCLPYLTEVKKPPTAEALMRSRYSAYSTFNTDYLIKTTHPSTRKFHDPALIEQWAKTCNWQKLELISVSGGMMKDITGTVEFKAYYLDSAEKLQIHHENSSFKKELGKWFYLNGKIN